MDLQQKKLQILLKYPKQADKILIAKIVDKLQFVRTKNEIQATNFLDGYEQKIVHKILESFQIKNAYLEGGYRDAERKIALFLPEKLEEIWQEKAIFEEENRCLAKLNLEKENHYLKESILKGKFEWEQKLKSKILNEQLGILSITLPNDLLGKYQHRDYLGAVIKVGINREKVGDILVRENGADMIVKKEALNYLKNDLDSLTRFQKAVFQEKQLEEIQLIENKRELLTILIPQLRLDCVIAELLHISRNKANEIIEEERAFVNYEIKKKTATTIKEGDILTIRGKGKYKIGNVIGNSSKGKMRLEVEKYC